MSARPIDLIAAARQRLAVQRQREPRRIPIAPELRHISDPAPARYPHLSFAKGVPVAADCVEVAA